MGDRRRTLENLVMTRDFWRGRKVLLTGHTGFKGAWLTLWLRAMGAEVAGFSDGGSYALSAGITNGDLASHVIVFSGGFMSVFLQHGAPRVFIAHGLADEQLPIDTSARLHAAKLKTAGYDVSLVEFNGRHAIQPAAVAMAMDFFLGPADR